MNTLITLLLIVGLQTATPTATPTSAGYQFPPPLEFKFPRTSTPIPTSEPLVIPTNAAMNDIYTFLAQAEEYLKDVPPNLDTDIVTVEDGRLLFSYIKWVFDPNITQELFDPFAPIPNILIYILFIVLIFAGIYYAITLAVFMARVALAVWRRIPLIGGGILFAAFPPPPPTPFPTPESYPFQPFDDNNKMIWATTDEAIQTWQMLPLDVRGLVQGLILLIIVIVGMIAVILFVRGMMESRKDG